MVALLLSVWLASPAGQLAAIEARCEADQKAAFAGLQDTPDTFWGGLAVTVARERRRAAWARGVAEALDLAERTPDDAQAWPIIEWASHQNRLYFADSVRPRVYKLLTERFAANPGVGMSAFYAAGYGPEPAARTADDSPEFAPIPGLLRAILARNPNRNALALARYGQGLVANRRLAAAQLAGASQAECDALAADAIAAFEVVVRDYADAPLGKNTRPLGEFAKAYQYELRHLRVGVAAPDLVGESLEGKPLKLSDHRGKVVVVAFWYTQCYWCMKAVPHERELTERYAGKPFTLFGVCADDTQAAGLKTAAANRMAWPHLWCGPEQTNAAIPRTWNVRGWPTVYVLDAQGVIRAKDVRGPALDAALSKLLPAVK